jgi:hypothetical protein
MAERRPRTALAEKQEMSSVITLVDDPSPNTLILTFSLREAFRAHNQVLEPQKIQFLRAPVDPEML